MGSHRVGAPSLRRTGGGSRAHRQAGHGHVTTRCQLPPRCGRVSVSGSDRLHRRAPAASVCPPHPPPEAARRAGSIGARATPAPVPGPCLSYPVSRSRDAASPPRRGGPSPRPKRSPSPEGSGPPGQDAGTGLSAGPAGGGQSGQGPRGLGEPSLPGPQSPLLQDGAPCRLHQLPLPTEAASPSPEQQAPGHTTPPPQGPHAPAHGTPQSQRISSGIAPVLGFRGSLGSSGTSKRASQEGEPGPGFTWVPQREERNRHKAARRWGHPETGDTPRLQVAGLTPAPPAPPLASGPRQPEPTPRLCGGGPCSGSTRSPRNTAPKPPREASQPGCP